MEALRTCANLTTLLESELRRQRLTTVTQEDSRGVLNRVAQSLGANPNVRNLFPLPKPLLAAEYVIYVQERLKQFAPASNTRTAFEQAEAAAFGDGVPDMLAQMSQWQKQHGTAAAPAAVTIEDGDSSDDSDDDSKSVVSPSREAQPRNDADETDDSDSEPETEAKEQKSARVEPIDPVAYAGTLLEDKVVMSKFTSETFSLLNPRGEGKIDVNGTQPFIDYLVEKNFEPTRLRKILGNFLNEYSHIRELNYSQFCYYVRFILSRYCD